MAILVTNNIPVSHKISFRCPNCKSLIKFDIGDGRWDDYRSRQREVTMWRFCCLACNWTWSYPDPYGKIFPLLESPSQPEEVRESHRHTTREKTGEEKTGREKTGKCAYCGMSLAQCGCNARVEEIINE